VLNIRNFNDKDNAVTQVSSDTFKLCLDLLDNTGLAAKTDFIRRLSLARATSKQRQTS
jgi:hypothetical protein